MKIKSGIEKCVSNIKKQEVYATSLQQLVQELKPHGKQTIVFGLMKYLKDPGRKSEFIIAKNVQKGYYVGPTASQTEMALIDFIKLMETSGINIWDPVLDVSEFILFTLERELTPSFDVVESVAHFYINICKNRGNTSRLWMFMLNAMYCLSFKAIPLIKHCLEIVPEVIPHSSTYIETGEF